jgi:hypothetical protein
MNTVINLQLSQNVENFLTGLILNISARKFMFSKVRSELR